MKLINADALREQIDDYKYFHSSFQKMTVAEFLTIVHELIDNAPTVEAPTYTDIIEANKEGYDTARRLYERSQYYCNKCDFRKFTEKFIGGVVELMKENDITSLELLSEMLGKGNDNDG